MEREEKGEEGEERGYYSGVLQSEDGRKGEGEKEDMEEEEAGGSGEWSQETLEIKPGGEREQGRVEVSSVMVLVRMMMMMMMKDSCVAPHTLLLLCPCSLCGAVVFDVSPPSGQKVPLSDDADDDDPEGEMQAELSARTELAVPADAEEVEKTSEDSGSSREIATEEKDRERQERRYAANAVLCSDFACMDPKNVQKVALEELSKCLLKFDERATNEQKQHCSLNRYHYRQSSFYAVQKRELERRLERGLEKELERGLEKELERELEKGLERRLERGLERELEKRLERGLERGLERELERRLERELERRLEKGLERELERRLER
ncbi:hypothetical protein F7725_009669 [Dissostichus mawsoni]|uniref:Uncharacterized protein n=1 Tax=Dissostichus mawsoni TaxID=36200 RepID=A0A7J5XLR3_DISMA|nr:hypothetical protein F7725_009669 [Dissostichus mawsoni]